MGPMGDKPAAALLTVAVEKASESWERVAEELKINPKKVKEDSIRLKEDCHVDDKPTVGSAEDINRMQGTMDLKGEFSGTIPSMFKAVSLKLKTMVRSFSDDSVEAEKLSGKRFGYGWISKDGLMSLPIKFNSSKRKGLRTQPDISVAKIESFKLQTYIRRNLLTICNRNFVP